MHPGLERTHQGCIDRRWMFHLGNLSTRWHRLCTMQFHILPNDRRTFWPLPTVSDFITQRRVDIECDEKEFCTNCIEQLHHFTLLGFLQVLEQRTDAIYLFEHPSSVTELRSCIGFVASFAFLCPVLPILPLIWMKRFQKSALEL